MSTLIIPDLHIGISYDGVDRTEDVFSFLEKLYKDNSEANNGREIVKRVIWLGDIFDSPNVSHSYIARFIKYLDRWTFVQHLILKGNHDGEADTKKGSPLLEVEASNVARVIWEPHIEGGEFLIPYTTQDKIDQYRDKAQFINTVYTHVDIYGVTPGIEKSIQRGVPCVLPDWVINLGKPIFAGHIHKPQAVKNLMVVGSVLKCDISEAEDVKRYLTVNDDGKIGFDLIDCRNVQHFDIDYSTDSGKDIYLSFFGGLKSSTTKDSIVSINLTCPHTLAHEIDQAKFQDEVRKQCYHLKFKFNVVKEKSFRMKELDNTKSDFELIDLYLTKQEISDKDLILQDLKEILK